MSQDLSVLFWAPEYYNNYCALLKALGIEPETVCVSYALCTNKYAGKERERQYFTPKGSPLHDALPSELEEKFATDLENYDRMVNWCRKVRA